MRQSAFGLTMAATLLAQANVARASPNAEGRTDDQAFLGKWVSLDRTEAVEFLPGHECILRSKRAPDRNPHRFTSTVYHDGKNITCGGGGMYTRISRNRLSFTFGMGDTPLILRRER